MGSVSFSAPDCPKCGSHYIKPIYVFSGKGVEPDEVEWECEVCGERFEE